MRRKSAIIGIAASAFGVGSLLALFLPCAVLVCLDAVIITGAGVLLVINC